MAEKYQNMKQEAMESLFKLLPTEEGLDPWEYGHSFGYKIDFVVEGNEPYTITEHNYYRTRFNPLEDTTDFEYDNVTIKIYAICDTGD